MSKRFKGLRNRNRSEDKANALSDQETSLRELTARGLTSRTEPEQEEQSEAPEQAAFELQPEEPLDPVPETVPAAVPEAETGSSEEQPAEQGEKADPEVEGTENTGAGPDPEAEQESGASAPEAEPQEEPLEMVNGDDPDKIPVKPSLSDDQVPNMPGAILRHAREMLGMSQREVATALKLRVNTISDLEHDRLNQPTAAPFASTHIANYARLVNIDPQALLSLYRQNVQEVVAAGSQERVASTSRTGHGWLLWSVVILVLMGVAGYYLIPHFSDKEGQSGTLLVNEVVSASQDKPGELDLNLEESRVRTEIVEPRAPESTPREDENTRKARAQALALGTNEINEDYLSDGNKAPEPQGAVIRMPSSQSLKLKTPPQTAQSQPVSRPQPQATAQPQPEVKAVSQPRTAVLPPPPPPAQSPALQTPPQSTVSPAQPEIVKAVQPVVQSIEAVKPAVRQAEAASQSQEPAPEKVTLASSLKDLSGSARLRGKQGLESMNKVTVTVREPVALRITDSRGKALANGSYKAGDKVTVSGIPPIKVAVSDSGRIRVGYMGGQVTVPARQQVSFTLPTK